eukprot:scaffold1355_cov268-Pinguiococcus_pyrenoidosus.AAC.8
MRHPKGIHEHRRLGISGYTICTVRPRTPSRPHWASWSSRKSGPRTAAAPACRWTRSSVKK